MPTSIAVKDANSNTQTVATNDAVVAAIQAVTGPVTPGTAATNTVAIGGVYNSSPPSLTNGQQAAMQLDASGNKKVNVVAGVMALETGGNLAAIAAAQGASGSGISQPTGGSGLLGWLSGIYKTLNNALTVSVSNFPSTQPISAASLPLPTGAAQESGGNLATIATAQGASATGITQPTGGSGVLGWLSGIYNKLNNPLAVTGTFWQATQPVSLATLPALVAGTAVAGKFGIDQTTPGTTNLVSARTNAYRNGGVAHRTSANAVDKLTGGGTGGVPTTPTGTGVTVSGGSLVSATSYAFAVVANNANGNTQASATVSVTPGGSFNGVALTITPVTNATSYDLFCSSGTTTAMQWVGRITSSQLAAGNLQITTSGTIAAGTSSANVINIACVGSASQTVNAQTFLANTAYQWTGLTPIVCTGYSRANVYVQFSVTDLRTAPSLVLAPMFQNQTDSNYYAGSLITVPVAGINGAALRQCFSIDVDGVTNLLILIDTITGQGASANIWVELM